MNVSIDATLAERLPGLSLGMIVYSGVVVSESPKLLRGRINLYVESLRIEHQIAQLGEIEGIREWRSGFKKLGIDPARYRPSSEALLRRLLQGNPFHWINTAVDVNNFFSIRFALPMGIYDRRQVEGNIVFRIGAEGESYPAINGREANMGGKPLLSDAKGAFGSPVVDSLRTSVKEGADELLHVIYFHPAISLEERRQVLGSVSRMFTEINGGTVSHQAICSG